MEKTIWDILKSPVVTEKAMTIKDATSEEGVGQVLTFRVSVKANKFEIKSAVENIFNVKVAAVRTQNYEGKPKRRGRFEGRRPSWKKAIVTLKSDQEPIDYSEVI